MTEDLTTDDALEERGQSLISCTGYKWLFQASYTMFAAVTIVYNKYKLKKKKDYLKIMKQIRDSYPAGKVLVTMLAFDKEILKEQPHLKNLCH